jgi:cell wall-associated NlpC family hydrolase
MTRLGMALADTACEFVGKPFRLGGRDPATGLDCIGLIVAALENIGRPIGVLPAYTMRQYDLQRFVDLAERVGLTPTYASSARGDVLLLRPSPSQCHLAISLGDGGIVHAHAELRRVVITPPPLPWLVSRRWRLA